MKLAVVPLLLVSGLALPATASRPLWQVEGVESDQRQDQQAKPKLSAAKRLQRARLALDTWLEAAPRDRDEAARDSLVRRLMAAEQPGLELLARRDQQLQKSSDAKLRAASTEIIHQMALQWLIKVEKSKTRFAGQYNDLRRLQPAVGEFYLRLLLDTPQWFLDTRRWLVIPALRDLYPKGPDRETLEQVEIMANNVEVEPEYLRVGLAYALAQWGRRDLIKTRIRTLETKAESENAELALLAKRDLAKIHYGIRDYSIAAVAYREYLRAAEAAGDVVPVNYYNAACCMCLSGDRRSALQFLARCLELNVSGRVDSSMVLKRQLFDIDPEIALVRRDPRFIALLEKAFGKGKTPPEKKAPR